MTNWWARDRTSTASPGRIARNTSVATRLSLVVLLVALVSLVITSVVGLRRGGELADERLRAGLNSLSAARADEIERYIGDLEQTTVSLAISPSTTRAINGFSGAYRDLQAQPSSMADEEAVDVYYVDTVAPQLSAVRGRPVNAASLVPRQPAAVYLQEKYVVSSDPERRLLTDAGDGSNWSELHNSLQPLFDEFVIRNDLDDVYLIEPDNKVIVYSWAKNIDFATSLLTGPHSGSALAVLINSFGDQPEPGVAVIEDFTNYAAVGDEPTLFVASPVFADGELAGFVAIRISPDEISSITTNNGSWREQGDTGETYVVARDNLMRSDARGFIENEDAYLAAVTAAGAASEDEIRSMRALGTTVLSQPIPNRDVDAALDLEPALVATTNYLGTDVLQARRALDIEGLDWAIIADVARQEISQPIADFARNLLIAIALFLVAITFIAVRWSERLLEPLRIISANLRAVRSSGEIEQGVSSGALPDDSAIEFVRLAGDIDIMLETLAVRNSDAAERASERRQLLRRILPAQAAHRVEAGERNVVDHATHATVAVVVIHGLGPLMRAGSKDEARVLLDRFVEETDALAKQRGLERIRLTGDAYYATCGTVRPYLDHAARAVSFVLDVRDLVRDLGDDEARISMSAGIDSGPVTVGLTGGWSVVYDAWGSTVQEAADLARRSGSNDVLVSASVRSQLPSNFVTEDRAGPVGAPGAAVVLGRASEGEPVR